ncbi:MAG: WD40 repeat protein/predicted Ser/Thr protein kinase [Planctomycetota bacterium]
MNDADQNRLFAIFQGALQLPLEERDAYLQESCADGDERAMLDSLLKADEANEHSPPKLAIAGRETLDEIREGTQQPALALDLLGKRIGKYILQSELGRGGMGIVYLAQQESTGQFVALKCLRPHASRDREVERFEQEIHVLGRLDHVGIAKVFDAGIIGEDGGQQHYFAMEYVRGRILSDYAREEQLGLQAVLKLIAAICDAVQHAHEHGVIHRDLKPANILVTTDGQPKVLDFGVSRVIDRDQQLTTLGSDGARLIGTLSYMSPEQAGGDHANVSATSDVFALGVIAYELLSGELPHDVQDRSLLSAAQIIRDQTPKRLRAQSPSFPTEVDTIVGKALEQDPWRRYASPAAMAEDLRRFLRHEPIQARPPNTLYSIVKFARRHRVLVSSSLMIMIVLLVAVVASLRWALKAEDARGAAEWSNYRTTLNLSEADLRQGQHSRAVRNLTAVDPSLRGWEWRYLSHRADQSKHTIQESHWLLVWSVAMSPDGGRAYTCGGDGAVKSWDLATGQLIAETDDHKERVFAVAASSDERTIATASVDVRIRDQATLETLAVIRGHAGTIHGLCFSPNGKLLASGDQNGTLLLSDGKDGSLVRELDGHDRFLWELSFSPDNDLLASSDAAGIVRIWNVTSGREVLQIQTEAGPAMGLAFSPDGKRLAIGSKDGALRLVSVESGEVLSTRAAHSEIIRDVAFSFDGKRVISASNDRSIGVWDSAELAPIARLTGHSAAVVSLSASPDSNAFLSTSEDRSIKSWAGRFLTDGNLLYPLSDVTGFAEDSDPALFHTLSQDSIITTRAISNGDPISAKEPADLHGMTRTLLALNGTLLVHGLKLGPQTSATDTYVNLPNGSVTAYEGLITDWMGLCLEGSTTWLSLPNGTLLLCDTDSGRVHLRIPDVALTCKTIAVDAEHDWIAAANDDQFVVSIRDLDSGTELTTLGGHSNSIEDLEFSPSSQWLLSASDDHTVKVWSTDSWEQIAALETHGAMDVRACFHPDETRLASVSSDGIVRIWSTETWDEILAVHLPPASGKSVSIGFSPNGGQLFVVMESGLHVLDARHSNPSMGE